MAYHHVLLTFEDVPETVRCVFSDLSADALKKSFLAPYRNGKPTLSGSEVIDVMRIRTAKIIKTENPIEVELKAIQEKSWAEIQNLNRESDGLFFVSAGYGYDPVDIADSGQDVTAEYISSPPGGSPSLSVSRVLNHPWVFAILSGLVIAGGAAWLGWN
jgi:hypothetical protein